MRTTALFIAGVSLFAATAFAGPKFVVGSSGFRDDQRAIVEQAAFIAAERISHNAVESCAYQRSNRVLNNQGETLTGRDLQESEAVIFAGTQDAYNSDNIWYIEIVGARLDGETLGDAYLNDLQSNFDAGTKTFNLRLNSRLVAGTAIDNNYGSADFWAGTIAHEMLHNWGLDHTQTGDYDADYVGNLVKEWGLCVITDGAGFSLNDYHEHEYRD